MGSRQRYERIAADDDTPTVVPSSPPPSFRSRTSSRRTSKEDAAPAETEQERNLNDAFDAPSDDESDDEEKPQDQRRLIPTDRTPSRSNSEDSTSTPTSTRPTAPERRITSIPVFAPPPTTTANPRAMPSSVTDGVFANISAKPHPGSDLEEKPPTYEQAAADATPPYWETSVLSPYATTGNPDDVFVDGLLVGSFFSFIWNGLISTSFQLIGFLLTYLLHTTHAAKHGSRAGLGITLVQYGFHMRTASLHSPMDGAPGPGAPTDGVPEDPNAHNFDPNAVTSSDGLVHQGLTTADWLSYVMMIVGWFILIRAVSDFMRARRQEALIRSSPDRGLGVAVIATGEMPESSV